MATHPAVFSVPASACPSLFRLAPARDGGIARIKPALGRLSPGAARAIAEAGARWGNGVIEITSRANVQIRGIAQADHAALAAHLSGAGLGAATAQADDLRNVLVSPLAGRDQRQIVDAMDLAESLLARLTTDSALAGLSPKFSILVDGGEDFGATAHAHDIWLSAVAGPDGAPAWLVGLAGAPEDGGARGLVAEAKILGLVEALLHGFAEAARDPAITRMRHWVGQAALDDLFARFGQAAPAGWRRKPGPGQPLGKGMQKDGRAWVAARPALGRLDPETLLAIADAVDESGGVLRLTPWQSAMVVDLEEAAADGLLARFGALGLVVAAGDPRADIVACSGSAGCAKGLAAVQADGLAIASRLPPGTSLHISGCEKSCAAQRCAAFTLVAVAEGRYDLFARSDAAASRFGTPLARAIGPAEAADRIAARPR